jgi:HPt (histidine-containing phosphotransfer) domain-containing protein
LAEEQAQWRDLFLDEYLEDLRTAIDALKPLVGAHRREEVTRWGHTLRGNASMFGLDDLVALGTAVEAAARSEDWAEVQALLGAVETAYTELIARLK